MEFTITTVIDEEEAKPKGPPLLRLIDRLPNWALWILFVATTGAFLLDLAIPDPILLLDEIGLGIGSFGALALALGQLIYRRWRKTRR